MKYLSVCSGIEAASVAWHPLGWTPLAFSEIEPFPRAVLQHHYPQVPLHGDFTALRDQPWIVDADVLVGGTPCQAFSVAGLRNSLADERGNLSLEYVRLADAIDNHRRMAGKDSAIIVWENVPGVLSVKDNAFGCFLAGLAGDVTPYVPPRGKWTNAGVVDGPQRTVAWRVLDAQYFGLAQRRRRVFVVASAREGFDPAAVLLEFEGVRRDSPPRREAGKGTAHDLAPSLTSSGRGVERTGEARGQDPVVAVEQPYTVANCLTARMHKGINTTLDEGQTPVVTHSLRAEGFDASEDGTGRGTPLVPVVCATGDVTHALTAGGTRQNCTEDGTGRGTPLVPVTVGSLTSGHGGSAGHQYRQKGNEDCLVPVAIPFDTTQITSPANYSKPKDGDPCHPLAAGAHPPAVAYAFQPRIARNGRGDMGDVVNALNAQSGETGKGDAAPCVAVAAFKYTMGAKAHGIGHAEEQSPTLDTRPESNAVYGQHMAVRRLTPVECERLQGFPDNYTAIPWKKKPASECPDGPRYKALENSMAVPVMRWIGRRIVNARP